MKRCRKCGERKPLRAFVLASKTEAKHNTCRACLAARQKERVEQSRMWIRRYAEQWRRQSCDIVERARRFIAGEDHLTSYYRLRHQAIVAYGGYRCACCGLTEALFLTIDHVENHGTAHRRQVGAASSFYQWLRDEGYPPGFQVLCSNCNFGRYRNGGVCPHRDPVT